MSELLSVVVPCYNEQETVELFYDAIREQAAKLSVLDWEFIFVDDGSSDDTLKRIRELREGDSRVHYVSFSRNFGKEAAIYAGLRKAKGDYVVLMDADLQDPPELIGEMYRTVLEEGYDCTASRRVTRQGEPLLRSFFARCFYRLINAISRTEFVDGARDFRLMRRQMVDSILELTEYNRFTKGIFSWVGYRTKWLEYVNVERVAGTTKWSFWKLFLYSLDGIVAFTTAPLALASVFGIIFFLVALVLIAFIIVRTLIFGDRTAGWPSLVCIICLIGGVQLFCTGIVGQYLARTYLETKRRPVYIVREEK
ncbi:glycosyltransferase involved in cell wall biosynthesis [Anaerotaenia torta]|uniref:glycosyltransferase family 2 protein n=1 Tax=Anaerotaenia torta TaxID=433293 RepID=UPI003D1BDAD5